MKPVSIVNSEYITVCYFQQTARITGWYVLAVIRRLDDDSR